MNPIEKFPVSRDDAFYHAWPDLALTPSGRLVCVFSECTHHFDRSHTRIVVVTSDDRGRTWSAKKQVTPPLLKKVRTDRHWNCARITQLADGRLVVIVDRVAGEKEGNRKGEQSNWLWFSTDDGETWSEPVATPIIGIVPDQIIEIDRGPYAGRWTTCAVTVTGGDNDELWQQRCWYSDDKGLTWHGPSVIAADPSLKLCEGSIISLPEGELVCFLRENSWIGLDGYRAISRDGGKTWGELSNFPLPGCHRPTSGLLQSGNVLITYRFLQGGQPHGWSMQNFFAAITDVESCLAPSRAEAHARIMPIDYDRSPVSDIGYSGWVQFADGEIYIVTYLLDDAPKGQIRGYSLREEAFRLPA